VTRRFPVLATVVVGLAVALLIALGLWQLRRSHENERLLAQYKAAATLPPIAYPVAPFTGPLPLFRWATGYCQRVVGQREAGGRSRSGEVGWAHIVDCATGAEGPGMSVEIGWSQDPDAKVNWRGGLVSGVIVPDRLRRMRLVAASAPPGLQPASLPSAETAVPVTPGRNRMYALQWFSFAAIALIIYGLALRKRLKGVPPKNER
jgi:cytochrome oxidase assembly protein ShyY1